MLSFLKHDDDKKQSEAIIDENNEHKDLSEDIHKTQHRWELSALGRIWSSSGSV